MNKPYKYDEIKDHFQNWLDENLSYIKENDVDWRTDLHHNAFNQDYYIIGRYQAKQWLGDNIYGSSSAIYEVIGRIVEYEQHNFGEILTDLSDPEKIVNMYTYIIGEDIVNEYLSKEYA